MSALNVRELGDFIRDQRRTAQISLRQLAKQAGVSNPYLSQIERGLRRPSAEILQQIAKALRISAEALYVQAGILEERHGGDSVMAAVLADESLSERQKQVVLDIYEAFCKENAVAAHAASVTDPAVGVPINDGSAHPPGRGGSDDSGGPDGSDHPARPGAATPTRARSATRAPRRPTTSTTGTGTGTTTGTGTGTGTTASAAPRATRTSRPAKAAASPRPARSTRAARPTRAAEPPQAAGAASTPGAAETPGATPAETSAGGTAGGPTEATSSPSDRP
ncbi:helix-turn-helix domain-containing protein [Frankia sp. R82]|uniref:helix-turn-helix domain-containing protein n=1 Tax=Frankia sp. R82 TaxID=2950553 RepID=UPI00204305AF|nr:helix-turn-helix domain-containing protein [Frankia sp. R82]MCM3885442.1 helix-turn-helix domain-containing protein [Frankia sp. R82]